VGDRRVERWVGVAARIGSPVARQSDAHQKPRIAREQRNARRHRRGKCACASLTVELVEVLRLDGDVVSESAQLARYAMRQWRYGQHGTTWRKQVKYQACSVPGAYAVRPEPPAQRVQKLTRTRRIAALN